MTSSRNRETSRRSRDQTARDGRHPLSFAVSTDRAGRACELPLCDVARCAAERPRAGHSSGTLQYRRPAGMRHRRWDRGAGNSKGAARRWVRCARVREAADHRGRVGSDAHLSRPEDQQPRETFAFSDFPYPSTADDFPTAEQVREYLDAYVEHFGLAPLLQLATEVCKVSRLRADRAPSQFELTLRRWK